MTSSAMVAVDLGGTHLRVAVFDLDGRELYRQRIDTPVDRPDSVLEMIRGAVAGVSAEVGSVVVAVPGPVSYQEGRPFVLPNLPGWAEHLSSAGLSESLGFAVVIANDADLAALGEHAFGAGRGVDDVVYITVSTGIGAGIVLGGRLLRGHRSLGEIGWAPLELGSARTVEEVASGTALRRRTGLPGEEVVRRARAGDEAALEALHEAGEALAVGVSSLAVCFAPERLVIGGGLGLGASDMLLGPVHRRLGRLASRGPVPDVRAAELGDDAGLRGAFAFWRSDQRRDASR